MVCVLPGPKSAEQISTLSDVRATCEKDVSEVEDPRALALFETTAEVLGGLITAYEHYERGAEDAWRD
jgi:hypothetical protein